MYAVQKPMRVAITLVAAETTRLWPNASRTSGSPKMLSYQCRVKWPRGIVGKRSELNEKTKLATIGANTNANTTTT